MGMSIDRNDEKNRHTLGSLHSPLPKLKARCAFSASPLDLNSIAVP